MIGVSGGSGGQGGHWVDEWELRLGARSVFSTASDYQEPNPENKHQAVKLRRRRRSREEPGEFGPESESGSARLKFVLVSGENSLDL